MDKRKDTRTPVQKRGKDKKSRILLTAKKLFIEKNYFEVSTNEIAKKTGVSIGTLYSYFSSKDDILAELLNDYNNYFLSVLKKINNQESFQAFKTDTKSWLSYLIDQLTDAEDKEFHLQIEMLSFDVPKVFDLRKKHNDQIMDLIYEYFLYYANNTSVHEIRLLSIIIFDYISALVDELLYNKRSSSEKDDIKKYGIDSIHTIIKTHLN
ncbi:TetR/AcrR family transcriptional regulator [Companilactobacillus musae]|uniref:TetR/AcrR family transcriptional regulator n=1 Tax=Companilactobacillus musae TaxID=1903258 RepID=UPI000E64A9BA|nr:TetR/AcrR family transcriptional regulator [Companilactobacillus musae]